MAASVISSGLQVVGHVHDEHVTQAPAVAQPGVGPHDLVHQLVGMQAAFHQSAALGAPAQGDRLRGRHLGCFRFDDAKPGNVPPLALRDRLDARRWPNQHRRDQPLARGIQCAHQGNLVDRISHRHGQRRQPLALRDQLLEHVMSGWHEFLPGTACWLLEGWYGRSRRLRLI